MDTDEYKLEDALTTLQSAMQEIERRILRCAIKRGISNDVRRQLIAHTDTIRSAIAKLPTENR